MHDIRNSSAAGRLANAVPLVATALFAVWPSAGSAATTYRCGTSTTSNNGQTEIILGGDISQATPCTGSAGSPASDALGHRVQASSQVEAGQVRGLSGVAGAPPSNAGLILGASSLGQFSESGILVGGLGNDGAQLDFRVRFHGVLDSDTTDTPFPFNTAVTASGTLRATLINETLGTGGTLAAGACVNNPNSSVSTCNPFGPITGSSGRSTEITRILTLSTFARNGDTLFTSLILETASFGFTPRGNFVEANANFNNTVDWLGLVPNSQTAGLTLTSGSGFDYLRGFAEPTPGGVPEPASWAMLVAGFGLTGAVMRRRTHRAVAA